MEAHKSLMLFSIKFGFSMLLFLTKYKMAVFSPEKLKFKPFTLT